MTRSDRTRGDRRPAPRGPAVDRRVRALRRRPARPAPAARRGLTLLEVLLGVAIVAALGGIVFATLTPLRDSARTRSAADRIASFVRDVRDLALRTGEPVVIALDPVAGRLEAEWLLAPPEERGGAGVRAAAEPMVDPGLFDEPSAGDGTAGVRFDDDVERRTVEEPWARLALGRGIRLSPLPPDVLDPDGGDDLGFGDPLGTAAPPASGGADAGLADSLAGAVADLFEDAAPVRLLVAMPDGTTLLARPAWLRGPDGSVRRLDVHPWTGEPTWTELGRAASDLDGPEDPKAADEPAAAEDRRAPERDEPARTEPQRDGPGRFGGGSGESAETAGPGASADPGGRAADRGAGEGDP